jgi:hypothetical protein
VLSHAGIAELLAQQAERETGVLARAFRRAARSAFLWPEKGIDLAAQNRPLTELRSIGPFIANQIQRWINSLRDQAKEFPRFDGISFRSLKQGSYSLRNLSGQKDFAVTCKCTRAGAMDLVRLHKWLMAARERLYEYIAIADHSQGLKIAGGIDERALKKQGNEIVKLNMLLRKSGKDLVELRSVEMNLNRCGEGDMSPANFRWMVGVDHRMLDLV